jgi:hypothetical protein
MSYISTSDVTDKIVDGFDITPYILEADDAVNDLAETIGVRTTTDICVAPLHYKVRRYAVEYTLMRFCQDKIAGSNTEVPESNKYLIGFEMHRKMVDSLVKQITPHMLTGDVNAISDRVTSVDVWRG